MIEIYINKIKKLIQFKTKNRYCLLILTPETMKILQEFKRRQLKRS